MNVLAKRLTPDRLKISMEDRRLHIVINSPEGELEFELDTELYDQVRKCPEALKLVLLSCSTKANVI